MPNPTKKDLALAKQLDALQRRYERRYEKQIFTALKKQMQPYLDAIKQADGNINRFDLITPAPLADTLETLYVVAGTAYAEVMYNAIQPPTKATKEALRAGWRDFMRSFAIKNLPQTLIKINETSQKIIRNIVTGGLNEGLGTNEIARNIQDSVKVIFSNRAKLIARTEMVIASNVAAMESSKSSDFMYEKKWIPATDTRTRPDHAEMRPKPWIPFDQNFIVGGNQMRQPGDGSQGAGADQICNCRCKVVFRIMRDADGLPMRKLGSQSGAYNVNNGQRQIAVVQPSDNLIANNLEDAKKLSTKLVNENTPLVVNKTIFSDEMTLDKLNRYNQQINKLTKNYNLSPHLDNKSQITLSFESTDTTYGLVEAYSNRITKINFGHKASFEERILPRVDLSKGYPRYARKSKVDMANAEISTLTHEFSHVISMKDDFAMFKYPQIQSFWDEMGKIRRRYRKEVKNLVLGKNYKELDDVYLGTYADTDIDEFMAEGFTEYQLSSNPSKYAKEIGQLIDKYFKK